jgi:hypothetical protein
MCAFTILIDREQQDALKAIGSGPNRLRIWFKIVRNRNMSVSRQLLTSIAVPCSVRVLRHTGFRGLSLFILAGSR